MSTIMEVVRGHRCLFHKDSIPENTKTRQLSVTESLVESCSYAYPQNAEGRLITFWCEEKAAVELYERWIVES